MDDEHQWYLRALESQVVSCARDAVADISLMPQLEQAIALLDAEREKELERLRALIASNQEDMAAQGVGSGVGAARGWLALAGGCDYDAGLGARPRPVCDAACGYAR